MRTLMKVLKNLFGNNTKISAEEIVIKSNEKANKVSNIGLIAKVGLTNSNFSIPASTYTKIPFNYQFKMDNGLELTSNGGIKINTNSRVAIVTARVRFETETNCILALEQNSDRKVVNSGKPSSYGHLSVSGVFNISKGDIIYCTAYSDVKNNAVGGGNPPIWVSMEVTLI